MAYACLGQGELSRGVGGVAYASFGVMSWVG